MKARWFVLIEPFGYGDVTICSNAGKASREVTRLAERGLTTRVVETTGTILDVRSAQRRLRAEHLAPVGAA